jgi:hypothetical protein
MTDPRIAPLQLLHIAEIFEMNGDVESALQMLEDVSRCDDLPCRDVAGQRVARLELSRRPLR